jgi:predicted DNA-binding protein (UPF0251 family)
MFVQVRRYADYLVDDAGTVVSLKSGDWRVMRPHVSKAGYQRIKLCSGPSQQKHTVHKLVATSFLGPVPDGFQINHKDGNKLNNRLENLEYVTAQQNIQHAHDTGLASGRKGETHHNVKLSDADVARLLDLKGKMTQKDAAALLGVSRSHVAGIWLGNYRNAANTRASRRALANRES